MITHLWKDAINQNAFPIWALLAQYAYRTLTFWGLEGAQRQRGQEEEEKPRVIAMYSTVLPRQLVFVSS